MNVAIATFLAKFLLEEDWFLRITSSLGPETVGLPEVLTGGGLSERWQEWVCQQEWVC